MKYGMYIFLVLFWLTACRQKKETTTATVETITESVYASGTVKSLNQYQVFASANGIITAINVQEGDLIKKGQKLLTLDNETPRLNMENARLSADYATTAANRDKLNELRINIGLAREKMQSDSLLLQRQQALWAQEIGSRLELEQRELAYKNSTAAYRSALARYNDLLKQIEFSARQSQKNFQISASLASDYNITAQQSGKVYKILKEPGEMVNTQTPIAIIGDANNYVLELEVDEFDIGKIKPGQKVYVNMDSYKGHVFEATILRIDPIMNERSRSFTVEATFTTKPENLYPNLTAEANILIRTKENALTIPRNYLLDEEHVLLENGEKKKITTGLKDYQKVEVLSGISKNDVLLKPAS